MITRMALFLESACSAAYVSMRQHMSACVRVSIRQHASAYVSAAYVSIMRQHASAYAECFVLRFRLLR